MSYSRSYHRNIKVTNSKTVTVHYPPSSSGGYLTKAVLYEEDVPVDINIEVDTNPFDSSVNSCNNTINTLTGSVVATESAQVNSIEKNSKNIAETIIKGFFKNINFELTSQISELTQKINAHIIHLNELSKRLIDKQKQMEIDYNRTSKRYNKIFDDLNNELANRVMELDKPIFYFKKVADTQLDRKSDNDLVSSIAVSGAENGNLQAYILCSKTKNRALDTINKANNFLKEQSCLNLNINKSMLNENVNATHFSLVCYLEFIDDNNQPHSSFYQNNYIPKIQEDRLLDSFKYQQCSNISQDIQSKIKNYLNNEINNIYSNNNPHNNRVKNTITKLLNLIQSA
jgi:hypothetical protein